jgi:putative SOS response-associated peptidase YedK
MCYYTQQMSTIDQVKKRFHIEIDNEEAFLQTDFINGFAYPNLPVILDIRPDLVTTNYTWGFLPSWAKDKDFRKNTLNARIETIDEKASFKDSTEKRCLIIATAYYEWRWHDEKGKSKQKYQINSQDEEIFTFAGLYNTWTEPSTGQEFNTYTMLTTEANEVMQYVHNHKKRMPILLNKNDEASWLDHSVAVSEFAYPYAAKIIALESN